MIHVLVVRLKPVLFIPLPPKAKLSKVTIPMTILTVEHHLSPRLMVLSSRDVVHSSMWLLRLRRGFFKDVKKSVKCVL
jgi:hypothetical protein